MDMYNIHKNKKRMQKSNLMKPIAATALVLGVLFSARLMLACELDADTKTCTSEGAGCTKADGSDGKCLTNSGGCSCQ